MTQGRQSLSGQTRLRSDRTKSFLRLHRGQAHQDKDAKGRLMAQVTDSGNCGVSENQTDHPVCTPCGRNQFQSLIPHVIE